MPYTIDPAGYRVSDAARIPSPALLVFRAILSANIVRAIAMAGNPTRLRPHVKTHKTPRIVEAMMRAGIAKYKCATIAEAEMLARCGAKDVLLAYQMVGPQTERFTALCAKYRGVSFQTIVDDEGALRALAASLARKGLAAEVLLDLDVGMHRTGIPPGDSAFQLYRILSGLEGVKPGGLHGYDGHNHQSDPAVRQAAAEACRAEVILLKTRLEKAGMSVPRMVLGGTPTFPCYARHPDTELSPGTCFLHDAAYGDAMPDLPFRPAALLLTRVVSVPDPGRFTLDLGHKAVSADPQGPRGIVVGHEAARAALHSEEHWTLEEDHGGTIAVGDVMYVVPTHICPTFALHQEVQVIGPSGAWEESWPVTARDRRISV
jgi:D-threonine aldolase